MADTRLRIKSALLPIRAESGKLILPDGIGSQIENMYLTAEGTLRSVWGPTPYVPNYLVYPSISYSSVRGVFHTTLGANGEKDILLIQDGNKILRHQGWNAGSTTPASIWQTIIGPTTAALCAADIGFDERPRFPTQFVATPNGIVIIPSGDSPRAFFFDGQSCLPLGYPSSPPPPVGWSPKSADGEWFNHTGVTMGIPNDLSGTVPDAGSSPKTFGRGRVGSIALDATAAGDGARVMKSTYRGAVQWLDMWGNLSPISGRSGPVVLPPVRATQVANLEPDDFLRQIHWDSIEPGPRGTIGRIFCRTKDEIHSGTLDLFEMPAYAEDGFLSPATIPDNVTESLPDNTPDSWLLRSPPAAVPVQPFRLYTLAFGRGWAANFTDSPGKLHPSMPGRWGTFLENEEIYPDPRGDQITGMIQVTEGLLVFTETTTFLITVSYAGEGFQSRTIHPRVGCSAPSSLAMTPDGMAIWLGREGFYGYANGKVGLISDPISNEVRHFNKARIVQAVAAVDVEEQKYRCWVPYKGSRTNNVCWQFDSEGWTRRTDVEAAGVCVTRDHRRYMIAGGKANEKGAASSTEGVWVLDHQAASSGTTHVFTPAARDSFIRTAWLRAPSSDKKASPTTVYLWLRETESGTLNVEVERDWRGEVTQTPTAPLSPPDDAPPYWTATSLGAVDADGNPITWKRRRPFWTRVDIYVPSAETFRLKITHTGSWEFLGMAFDEIPHPDTFRSFPK